MGRIGSTRGGKRGPAFSVPQREAIILYAMDEIGKARHTMRIVESICAAYGVHEDTARGYHDVALERWREATKAPREEHRARALGRIVSQIEACILTGDLQNYARLESLFIAITGLKTIVVEQAHETAQTEAETKAAALCGKVLEFRRRMGVAA